MMTRALSGTTVAAHRLNLTPPAAVRLAGGTRAPRPRAGWCAGAAWVRASALRACVGNVPAHAGQCSLGGASELPTLRLAASHSKQLS